MPDLQSFYSLNISKYSATVKQLSKQVYLTSAGRLISFIVFAVSVFFCFKNIHATTVVTAALSLLIFLWLIKRSSKLTYQKDLARKLLFVNENELRVLNYEPNSFDNGSNHQTGESYFADLDIFGEGSLYHLLNRTSTSHGAKSLSEILKQSLLSPEAITNQQEAIKTFAPQHALREMVIAKSLLHNEDARSLTEMELWIHQPFAILHNSWMSAARFIIPAVNVALIFVCLYVGQYYLLPLSVLITWLHVGYYGKYTNEQHVLISKKEKVLKQYAEILKEFERAETGSSVVMQFYKDQAAKAHEEIRKLSNLANLLDQRLNLLVVILLNSFLMYDVQCLFALEKWKAKNQHQLMAWIECVGHIEQLTSLATFAFNHPGYSYPEIENGGKLLIKAKGLAHPLIKDEVNVANNISLGQHGKLLLITGSNMSGKTTFLRTVGVNILLAQCGLTVCAERFHFTPVHIHSSIRISDSLQENTSYFMAELKRLHEIKQSIASQRPSLVLIDEILRGTNSEDKYYGSEQFVQQLIKYNCLTLFATHDLKLSELENKFPGVIENYCFESTIENDELLFDYKILKGVAQNKNASFLMKKMEII